MTPAVRKPPVDARFALHHPRALGKCPWCGEEVTERTPVRKQLKTIHDACAREVGIITAPEQARRALFERDKGVCANCGEDWSERYAPRPAHPKSNLEVGSWGVCTIGKSRVEFRWNAVIWISLWHNDHVVPLWKVVDMPPLERLAYFMLDNMQTLCTPCHVVKCREEEAEKAKYDRREKAKTARAKPKRDWGNRPMRQDWKPRVRDINDD